MSHPVKDEVDAELVGLVRFVDRLQSGIGPLPVLGNIGVVIDHRNETLRRVVILEYAAEERPPFAVRLRNDIERTDFVENVKDLVRYVQIDEFRVGHDLAERIFERSPAAASLGE